MTRQSRKAKKARKSAKKAREAKVAPKTLVASDTSSQPRFVNTAVSVSFGWLIGLLLRLVFHATLGFDTCNSALARQAATIRVAVCFRVYRCLVWLSFYLSTAIDVFESLACPPSAPPAMPKRASFLGLPLELRLEIYEWYFASIPYESPQRFTTPSSFRPPLLRVCHQIRREALKPYLYRLADAHINLETQHHAFMAHLTALPGPPVAHEFHSQYLKTVFENQKLVTLLKWEMAIGNKMRKEGGLGVVTDRLMDPERLRELGQELRSLVGQGDIETGEEIIEFAEYYGLRGLAMTEVVLECSRIFEEEYWAQI